MRDTTVDDCDAWVVAAVGLLRDEEDEDTDLKEKKQN